MTLANLLITIGLFILFMLVVGIAAHRDITKKDDDQK